MGKTITYFQNMGLSHIRHIQMAITNNDDKNCDYTYGLGLELFIICKNIGFSPIYSKYMDIMMIIMVIIMD